MLLVQNCGCKDTHFYLISKTNLLFFQQIPLFFIYFQPLEAILAANYGFNQLVVVARGVLHIRNIRGKKGCYIED